MTTDITVGERETTVEEIATFMRDENVGAIPIVDEDNALEGIVTDRDIVVRCIANGRDPAECTAEDIMTDDCYAVAPETEVDQAARLMADKQIRRLAIVEDGELVGMLSIGDVAVKQGDDDLCGEALQEISQGVKDEGAPGAAGTSARMQTGQAGSSRSRVRTAAGRNQKEDEDEIDRRKVVPFRRENIARTKDVAKAKRGQRKAS
jgi:predicted transcriptional regulator